MRLDSHRPPRPAGLLAALALALALASLLAGVPLARERGPRAATRLTDW